MGFGVRKEFENKRKLDGKVTAKRFVCCKEGFRKVDKRNHHYTHHRNETRTNCSIKLSTSLIQEIGKYKVYDFVAECNHVLHLEGTTYMIKPHRKMSKVQASEISSTATHALMSKEASGRGNLEYTELDQKKFLRSRWQRNLKYGEVGSLLNYF
jgi:zinc finger SWIM domain-containing protein 3